MIQGSRKICVNEGLLVPLEHLHTNRNGRLRRQRGDDLELVANRVVMLFTQHDDIRLARFFQQGIPRDNTVVPSDNDHLPGSEVRLGSAAARPPFRVAQPGTPSNIRPRARTKRALMLSVEQSYRFLDSCAENYAKNECPVNQQLQFTPAVTDGHYLRLFSARARPKPDTSPP